MRSNPTYYTDDPTEFLIDILLMRPAPQQLIERRAVECGFSTDQLNRAKRKLGIVTFKERGTMSGKWYWARPEHVALIPPNRKQQKVSPS